MLLELAQQAGGVLLPGGPTYVPPVAATEGAIGAANSAVAAASEQALRRETGADSLRAQPLANRSARATMSMSVRYCAGAAISLGQQGCNLRQLEP